MCELEDAITFKYLNVNLCVLYIGVVLMDEFFFCNHILTITQMEHL